jgi:RNA polymerase sigma-70 factor (ECF subfamily)
LLRPELFRHLLTRRRGEKSLTAAKLPEVEFIRITTSQRRRPGCNGIYAFFAPSKLATEMQSQAGITQLLTRWSNGDQTALDKLMPMVYSELRRLANNYLRRERRDHTLQPTALVNEAYLKLIDQKTAKWQNRAQFYGIAAQLMRRILVDHARQHKAAKRGGSDQQRLSITSAGRLVAKPDLDVLALHEALEELATIDPQQERIVELKFFGGLSIEETAEVLGVGHATVERDWKMARAWLRRKLE